jgi:hypothetical protein
MGNLVKTGLGPSRKVKEAEKKHYWDADCLIPGVGVDFTWVNMVTKEELEAVMQDAEGRIMYPQAAQTEVGLKITTSGYTGTVVVSGSKTFHIVNGLITSVA